MDYVERGKYWIYETKRIQKIQMCLVYDELKDPKIDETLIWLGA